MAKGAKTGGRKKGVPNKASIARAAEIASSGLTPLDYMLSVLRDVRRGIDERLEAAKSAAPYVHPKLASMELTGKGGGPLGVNIVRFGDQRRVANAPERLGAAAVPDEGVDSARTGVPPRRSTLAPPRG